MKTVKAGNAKANKGGLPAEGEVSYVLMDLADLDSVRASVDSILAISKKIDYVILNAGVVTGTY